MDLSDLPPLIPRSFEGRENNEPPPLMEPPPNSDDEDNEDEENDWDEDKFPPLAPCQYWSDVNKDDDNDKGVQVQLQSDTHEVIKKWTYADDVLYIKKACDGYKIFYDTKCNPDSDFYDSKEVAILEVHHTETDKP